MIRMFAEIAGLDPEADELWSKLTMELKEAEKEGPNITDVHKRVRDLWIIFIRDVAQPHNNIIADILRNKSQLCMDAYPDAADSYLAHVAELDLMLARWRSGDMTCLRQKYCLFPDDFFEWIVEGAEAARKMKGELDSRLNSKAVKESRVTHIEKEKK